MDNKPKKRSAGMDSQCDPKDDMMVEGNLGHMPDSSSSASKKAREEFDFHNCSEQLTEIVVKQLELLDVAVKRTLSKFQPKAKEIKPWLSEWVTDKLHLAVPVSGLSVENNLIDQVILSSIRNAKTRVVFTQGMGAEDIPDLSAEDERFLNGILSAVTGHCPSTLKCGSSSIVDLTFYSLWNLAAARFLADKNLRGHIHPAILPEKPIRGGAASKYLEGRLIALKATLGDTHAHIANTIERAYKLWAEIVAPTTQGLLERSKIPWSLVLSKGGEYQVKTVGKGKDKRDVRQLTTPINPKESAWVLPTERKVLSHLLAPYWSQLDALQKEWVALDGPGTHAAFESYISRVKAAYNRMRSISDSMTRRLGQRKAVVLGSPEIRKLTKKELKETPANKLVVTFAKSALETLPKGAKAVFSPLYAGETLPEYEWLSKSVPSDAHAYPWILNNYDTLYSLATGNMKHYLQWLKVYVLTFKPPEDIGSKDVPANVLETFNQFSALS